MKVLLISTNTEKINMPVLPLGLACVAAAVEREGHRVKMLDLISQGDTQKALEDAISEFNPEVIGISVRNIDDQNMANPRFLLEAVKEVVACCRIYSDATMVLGGAGYSIFPQATLDFLEADMGIQGEGETTFPALLEKLRDSEDPSALPGVYLAGQSARVGTQPARDLTHYPLPLPHVHLSTPSTLHDQEIWIPFQTRRGCPLECSYCSTAAIEGRIIREHHPEKVVEAIAGYAKAGLNHFFFVDNTFNLPTSYAKTLCDRIISAGLKIAWRCILYPWKVDDVLAEKMARAGCKEVSLGFESGSPKILKAMNKKFRPADVRRISQILGKAGIARVGFLLLGGPGETEETAAESLTFADSLGLEAMKISIGIRVYPNTPLARTALDEGLIEPGDDLLRPQFYIVEGLEGWLRDTVAAWLKHRPNWIM